MKREKEVKREEEIKQGGEKMERKKIYEKIENGVRDVIYEYKDGTKLGVSEFEREAAPYLKVYTQSGNEVIIWLKTQIGDYFEFVVEYTYRDKKFTERWSGHFTYYGDFTPKGISTKNGTLIFDIETLDKIEKFRNYPYYYKNCTGIRGLK